MRCIVALRSFVCWEITYAIVLRIVVKLLYSSTYLIKVVILFLSDVLSVSESVSYSSKNAMMNFLSVVLNQGSFFFVLVALSSMSAHRLDNTFCQSVSNSCFSRLSISYLNASILPSTNLFLLFHSESSLKDTYGLGLRSGNCIDVLIALIY